MPISARAIIRSQFRAAMRMLTQCIDRCPEDHWDATVGKYPFWQVVYHTLCFVDCYLSPSSDEFQRVVASRGSDAFNPQPQGMADLEGEYPSRRFTRDEMRRYAEMGAAKLEAVLGSESEAVLEGPSGFPWLKFSRAEAHLYNLRHVQHHTGQLTASLRRAGVDTDWVKAG